jgi:hypothetical protein
MTTLLLAVLLLLLLATAAGSWILEIGNDADRRLLAAHDRRDD